MTADGLSVETRSRELRAQLTASTYERADRFFGLLMMAELATWLFLGLTRPLGASRSSLPPFALPVLGAVMACGAIIATRLFRGRAISRHVVAVSQLSWALLLSTWSAGQFEAGYLVACSIAFLSFYRDSRVLCSAAAVAALGWFSSRALAPGTTPLDGIGNSLWSHGWLLLEVGILWLMIRQSVAVTHAISDRQALLELTKSEFEGMAQAKAQELAKSQEQYRFLETTTHSISWVMDTASGNLIFVGPQVAEVTGIEPDEWLRPSFLKDHLHPDDVTPMLAALASAVSLGQDQEIECRFRTKNEGEWLCLRSVIKIDRAKTSVVRGLLLDVTHHRRLETELRQAQKLESVGRLATGVVHEINTPIQFVTDSVSFARDAQKTLSTILAQYQGLARLVQPEYPEAVRAIAQAEEEADIAYLVDNVPISLERAIEGLGRVASIVRSMKEFAHPGQREKRAVDINRIVENTLLIAKNEYKYVADVETSLGLIPLVTCEAGEIGQAVLNIVVNAAHAISDQVKGTERRGAIKIRTEQEAEFVVISIEDTGGGIPESIQKRVFDPFFTTKESGRGTGQGLAIARAVLVEKHGGDLTFVSRPTVGTTFFLRIPIVEPSFGTMVA